MNSRCMFKHSLCGITGLMLCSTFLCCASLPGEINERDVYGIVTDSNSSPVSGYVIMVDEKFNTITNKQGVFILHNVNSNNVSFTGEKEGYETIEIKNKSVNKSEILCIEISTVEELIALTELYLKNGNTEKANETLEKFGNVNNQNGKVLLLKSLTALYEGDLVKAKYFLGLLKKYVWSNMLSEYERLIDLKLSLNMED